MKKTEDEKSHDTVPLKAAADMTHFSSYIKCTAHRMGVHSMGVNEAGMHDVGVGSVDVHCVGVHDADM